MPRELVPLDEISPRQAKLFAEAITLSTNAVTPQQQRRLQEVHVELDPKLLRPDVLSRMLTGGQSRYTPLCDAHRYLNASPIHSIFLLFQLEVGVRLNTVFQAGHTKVGVDLWDNKILNFRSLHGLWMSPDTLGRTFHNSLRPRSDNFQQDHYRRKWRYEESGCQACIIAQIVGNLQTLFDLWALIKSRIARNNVSRNPKIPRLLTWIEHWVELASAQLRYQGQFNAVEAASSWAHDLSDDLYAVRKNVRKSKHKHRSRTKTHQSSSIHRKYHAETTKLTSYSIHHDRPMREHSKNAPYVEETEDDEAFEQFDADDREEAALYSGTEPEQASYAALISTPFLPQMDVEEHKKAEASLRKSVLSQTSKSSNPQSAQFNPGQTRSSNYIPPRQSAASRWTDVSVPHSETDRSTTLSARGRRTSYSYRQRGAEFTKFDTVREESLSDTHGYQDFSAVDNMGQGGISSRDIEAWASGVSQAIPKSSAKHHAATGSVSSTRRDTHRLYDDVPERVSLRHKSQTIGGAWVSKSFSRVETLEDDDSTTAYTFRDIPKKNPLPASSRHSGSVKMSQTVLLPLRYDPTRQEQSNASTVRASSRRSDGPKSMKLTDIPQALRPASGASRQTTWSGMYKDIAVSNGRHSVAKATVPLEQYVLSKEKSRNRK